MNPTTTEQSVSLRAIVEEMYEAGKTTHELAETMFDAATEEENRKAAVEGWADAILRHERRVWAEPKPDVRSGHKNASGRLSKESRPDQGIFGMYVRTNDGGTPHKIADLTVELCARLKDEYRSRERHEAAGRLFFSKLEKALREKDKQKVAELGAEQVEAIRAECGYRE